LDLRSALARIDWTAPWLAPYRDVGQALSGRCCAAQSLPAALNALAVAQAIDCPQFVPQADLPEVEAYEAYIFRTHCVPTRDNLHDFFNGLIWLHCPQMKRRLNVLQATEIAQHGVQAVRGVVRDALTLFDENAALLSAPEPLLNALKNKNWTALFVQHRALWAQAKLQIFGHALLEKLVVPRKTHTAHVWCGGLELSAATMATKPFAPLPVLGLPGWCADNEQLEFYADTRVFRH
jgi:Protein of unknown function (DUF3025)